MAEAAAGAAPLGCPGEPSPATRSGPAGGADGSGLQVSMYTVRDALKAELTEFFGSRALFCELLRQEVRGVVESSCGRAFPDIPATESRHGDVPVAAGAMPDGTATESRHADVPDATSSYGLCASHSVFSVDCGPPSCPEDNSPRNVQPPLALGKVVTDKSSNRTRALEKVVTDKSSNRLRVLEKAADNSSASRRKAARFARPSSPSPTRPASGRSRFISEVECKLPSEPLGSHLSQTQSSAQSMSSGGVACQHFHTVAMGSHATEDSEAPHLPVVRHRTSLLDIISGHFPVVLEEQAARKSKLSVVVTSPAFETTMRAVILVHCAFMVYLANEDIKAWDSAPNMAITAGEITFLIIYAGEMIAKLMVYRASYFCKKSNCFDCLLVCIDVWDLVTKYLEKDAFSASYLTIFRLLRLGKALRALQVVRAFEKLQAFLICINGSLSSLAWSLVMLSIILYMFSLGIVQIIALYFKDAGDRLDDEGRRAFESLFGSVQLSMLTLFQLSTDGSGWKESYDLISQTGWVGSTVFLAYVSFTHIAVINIITGIFVESAMQNLAPDRDSLALDHQFKEEQAAQELEELFMRSNTGCTGRVSQEEFDSLIKDGRLPRLLSLLGLREQHARDFFKFLSTGSPDGEVSITSFVRGCMKLKGSATSFDLHMLQVEVHTITRNLKDLKRRTQTGNSRSTAPSPARQAPPQASHV